MNQTAQPDTWGAIREEMERLRAERDAAIHERDTYARGMDALAAQLAVASDKRQAALATERLAIMERVAPHMGAVAHGHDDERDSANALLAHVAEHGKRPARIEEWHAAYGEWEKARAD